MLKVKYIPKCPRMETCGTVSIVPITLAKNPTCMNMLRPDTYPTQGTSVKTATRLSKLRTLGGNTCLNIVSLNHKYFVVCRS